MSEAFNTKQNEKTANLTKVANDSDIQLHVTHIEVDEDVCEIALHVYDVTLKNFVAKRLLLGISRGSETPRPIIT